MFEFENGNFNGIFYSRFIASWVRKGGMLKTGHDISMFRSWLTEIGCDDETVDKITFLASNGKLELENSAKKFLAEH